MRHSSSRRAENHRKFVPAFIGKFPHIPFDTVQPGDVLLMNTNNIPGLGKIMGRSSPAGQFDMTHVAVVLEAAYRGNPNAICVWDMFEDHLGGAKIRPIQGSERLKEDMELGYQFVSEDATNNKMMVIRYVGPERDENIKRVQEVIRQMHRCRKNIKFPNKFRMYVKNALAAAWRPATPDASAHRYAEYARCDSQGVETNIDQSVVAHDARHNCSSMVAATWQAALGRESQAGSEEETEALSRLPLCASLTRPTDWSLLPTQTSCWKAVGVVTQFSAKRRFSWFSHEETNP